MVTNTQLLRYVRTSEQPNVSAIEDVKTIRMGQWVELGRHLLYCGDSSDAEFIDKCKEVKASFTFADPPYNAGVASWDNGFEWRHDYLIDVSPIVAVTPGIAATKDFMRLTSMPYKWSMSYWICNGMTRGAIGFGNWVFVALFTNGSLYRQSQDMVKVSIVGLDKGAIKHKGRKPIRMMLHMIELFTHQGDVVIDPFLGTGTTLMACEQTGRTCIGAEISPTYCESIIERWEGKQHPK